MKFKMMYITLVIIGVVLLAVLIILNLPAFGKSPSGERLDRIKASSFYKDDAFQNLTFTPSLADGYTMSGVMWDFLFGKKDSLLIPKSDLPSDKIDLKSIPESEDAMVWLGHSSYLLTLKGVTFLVDPVLSSYGAPFSFMNKAFKGTSIYSVEDLPIIDYLVITHDHYDHLDYETVKKIQNKVKKVILPLGVGSHLEYWGYQPEQLIEKEWYEKVELEEGYTVDFTPARHFSGRLFKRNGTLWASYVLKTPNLKIFIGGDSGYGTHFKEIGQNYGPFDYAILENGQYNEAWHYIHCLPEEVVQAGIDLKADKVIPVHFGKFALAKHAWNEPILKVDSIATERNLKLSTPKMGELLKLNKEDSEQNKWWLNL